eukprot:TRINITY_DN38738_c0_g1_i1.p1 TRINITY_DN38738_c0_g1~~TRINITY_DN38738_c0_g1_i1.p1  ORF type:complete len:294 (+),score=77.15 TRINITY_DN38738_c0_g1_i1:28-882(+)
MDAAVEAFLLQGFSELIKLSGWGNARDVDSLWKGSMQHRADRVVSTMETEKRLMESDVRHAVETLTQARQGATSDEISSLVRRDSDIVQQCQTADADAPAPRLRADTREAQQTVNTSEEVLAEVCGADNAAVLRADVRDSGVTDAIWAELEAAKAQHRAREEEENRHAEALRVAAEKRQADLEREWREEMERLRLELEEHERQEALQRAREAHEAKLAAERKRREEEEERRQAELRKAKAVQEKLRQISPCPAGYQWYKAGGGWRCGGGSHFVSDAQLNSQFTF